MSCHLWYSLRRNSIEIPFPTRKILASQYQDATAAEERSQQRLIGELRRVYPTLKDEELELSRGTAHSRVGCSS